jgi:fatty acid desaturase
MRDDALARFTEHQLPREALHALMARSDGPALLRTAWHLGVLALTGTLLGENMRTTLTLVPVRLFAWNMPYHSEHHAYPAVPFHALPRLHEQVRSRLEHVEPGYMAATVEVNRLRPVAWHSSAPGLTIPARIHLPRRAVSS